MFSLVPFRTVTVRLRHQLTAVTRCIWTHGAPGLNLTPESSVLLILGSPPSRPHCRDWFKPPHLWGSRPQWTARGEEDTSLRRSKHFKKISGSLLLGCLPPRNSFHSRGDFTVWLGPRVPENRMQELTAHADKPGSFGRESCHCGFPLLIQAVPRRVCITSVWPSLQRPGREDRALLPSRCSISSISWAQKPGQCKREVLITGQNFKIKTKTKTQFFLCRHSSVSAANFCY